MSCPIYIVGTGFFLPEERISNPDLVARLETTEAWIDSHTGIVERRRAPADMDTSDLGVRATERALERTGWDRRELDLLICATSTPDCLIPPTASYIGKKLEIDPVCFDVNAACSGFVYGLAVARAMIEAFGYRRVAVCTPEKYTRVTDYADRSTAIFFGDGAATVLLQAGVEGAVRSGICAEVVDIALSSINEGADCVRTPIGGYFQQDGRRTLDYAMRGFRESATDILQRNGLAAPDLRAFIGHQANLRVLERVAAALRIDPERHWHNVSTCGNQGAAGVATTLCSRLEDGSERLSCGDWILLTVFGSGFTIGSALLRWTDPRGRGDRGPCEG